MRRASIILGRYSFLLSILAMLQSPIVNYGEEYYALRFSLASLFFFVIFHHPPSFLLDRFLFISQPHYRHFPYIA